MYGGHCGACGAQSQPVRASVHRFAGPIVLLGYLLLIPSLMGVAFGMLIFLVAMLGFSSSLGAGLGWFAAMAIAAPGIVGGLIGWALVGRKAVLSCPGCGSVRGQLA